MSEGLAVCGLCFTRMSHQCIGGKRVDALRITKALFLGPDQAPASPVSRRPSTMNVPRWSDSNVVTIA